MSYCNQCLCMTRYYGHPVFALWPSTAEKLAIHSKGDNVNDVVPMC